MNVSPFNGSLMKIHILMKKIVYVRHSGVYCFDPDTREYKIDWCSSIHQNYSSSYQRQVLFTYLKKMKIPFAIMCFLIALAIQVTIHITSSWKRHSWYYSIYIPRIHALIISVIIRVDSKSNVIRMNTLMVHLVRPVQSVQSVQPTCQWPRPRRRLLRKPKFEHNSIETSFYVLLCSQNMSEIKMHLPNRIYCIHFMLVILLNDENLCTCRSYTHKPQSVSFFTLCCWPIYGYPGQTDNYVVLIFLHVYQEWQAKFSR